MSYLLEQECPQCGAPLELEETDRLLSCAFCGVASYLANGQHCRMMLPSRDPDRTALFVPYLHFKGTVYSCDHQSVKFTLAETTRCGVDLPFLPVSLGLRPQAMKMRYFSPMSSRIPLRNSLPWKRLLDEMIKPPAPRKNILEKAYIGEILNIIYLPLFLEEDSLFDAVLDRPFAEIAEGDSVFLPHVDKGPGWSPLFLASICPGCGWNLSGARDSVVLFCENCNSAWSADGNRLKRVSFAVQEGAVGPLLYLPFWQVTASTDDPLMIQSFADFLRVTNQPRVSAAGWQDRAMLYYSPAFKIRPKTFLRLATQATISQDRFSPEGKEIAGIVLHPTTLPHAEAIQALKIILAHSAVTRESVFPHLQEVNFTVTGVTLILLPFTPTSHEFVQQQTGIAINRQNLEFGRAL